MSKTPEPVAGEQQVLQDLGPLNGLPGDAKFINVIGKRPIANDWNERPDLWLTAQQAVAQRNLERKYTGTSLMTGKASGRLCWLDFDGETTLPDGTVAESATADFEFVFLRPAAELPKAPTSISGRPGRKRLLFRVPEQWVQELHGFSITNAGPTRSFDFLYEKAGGKLFHAVVDGKHPDGQDWFYRWTDGHSPSEIQVPDLPAWVLRGLVVHRAKRVWTQQVKDDRRESSGVAGGDAGPIDLLHPGLQRKLLNAMQKFWPYRAPRDQFKPDELGARGDYKTISRLVLSLAKGISDFETMALWLEGGHWDRQNDWAGEQLGVNPVNGGSLMTLARSLMRSDTQGEEVVPWAAAWSIAVENGWKAPKWALPPREFDVSKLGVDVAKKVEQMQEALKIIDAMDTPLDRCFAYQNLSRALDVTQQEFKLILTQAYEQGSQTVGGDWNAVVARAKPIEVAIERLLAFNALTIVGSDGGVGKSVLLYRIAEAAANGNTFAGSLETVKGNVLIIQKDESDSNLAQKNRTMQLNIPDGTVRVEFSFNAGMFPELRQWIREHKARYVLMDSMVSLFGGGTDLSEGEIGTFMYLLNAMAAEEGCAIVLTHHLRKQGKDKGGKRQDISMSDLYGSAFIGAGTSDLWGVIRDPESSNDAPKFLLKVLKPRTGVTQGGDTFLLSGSTEDLSFHVEQLNSDNTGVVSLRKGTKKLLGVLKSRTKDTPCTMDELISLTGMSNSQVRRLIKELMSATRFGVQRVQQQSSTGRPSYRYWAT